VDLSTLLQYSSAEGHPALKEFIRNFVEKVYRPGFADWQVQLNVGATAGWSQVVAMLMERGDAILVEEFTYPGAMNAYQPLDIKPVS
jgi:aromatic amino acid aminotransferase I